MTSPGSQFDVVGMGLNAMDTICVMDSFPKPKGKTPLRQVFFQPGGQVATALVTTSRLGLRCRYIGSVGSDDVGGKQLQSLKAEGLDVQFVRVVDGADSPISIILLEEGIGERTVLWRRDARLEFPAQALQREAVCNCRLLHLDGCDSEAALQAARWARDAKIPIVIDIDEIYDDSTHELLTLVDHLIASQDFAESLAGGSPPADAARILADRYRCPIVGVTCGASGAVFHRAGRIYKSEAFQISAADTTGAGDVFHGGYIYGFLQGWPLEETVRFAHAAAALKCTKIGARTGIPNLAAVQRFLDLGANGIP